MSRFLNRIDDIFLLRISLLGFLAYKATTFNLWFSFYRNFPTVSPVDVLIIEQAFWIDALSTVACLCLLLSVYKVRKPLLLLFLALEVVLTSFDMMRWQPSTFQALLTVTAFIFNKKYFKTLLLLILSATYLFSGLHKLNLRFINIVWCYSILVDFLGISKEIAFMKLTKGLGFLIPLAEIVTGILILTRWRKYGFYLIILTHLFILIMLDLLALTIMWPFGHGIF